MKKFEIREIVTYNRYIIVEAENEEEADNIANNIEDWNETDTTTEERNVTEII